MRLKSIEIAGFRGFPRSVALDLDADAIIVAGVNGSGKTSFFDALLWALSGSVPRLHKTDPAVVVSEYSPTGEARVEVVLSRDDGSTVTIVRRFDDVMHLSVQLDADSPVAGSAAEAALIDLLWPDAKSAANQAIALTRSLTSATYLQQDVVRGFVDADDDQTRFAIVGELVGVGRIGELQRQLESSKNVWTRATTGLAKDRSPLNEQRSAIVDRLSRLRGVKDVGDIEAQFRSWSIAVAPVIGDTGGSRIEPTADGLDRALSQLLAREQSEARRVAALEQLSAHLASEPPEAPDSAPLAEAVTSTESRMREVAVRLGDAEQQSAELRRRQVEVTEQVESLRTLAQLALRHLGERCPVCAQEYDQAETRTRLEELLHAPGTPPGPTLPDIATIADEYEVAQRQLSEAQAALRSAEIAQRQRNEWSRGREMLQREVELAQSDASVSDINELLMAANATIASNRLLRAQGEQLSLGLARAAELAQRDELERQLATVDAAIADQQALIDARNATGDLAATIIEALRTASSTVVAKQLERIEPLLQRIFATVDPHPSFRVVRFLTRTVRGHGRLWTTINDVAGEKSVEDPSMVLSSSQLNVLAVAIFLSLNLSIPTLPLQVVALDDPLQSLDTVNLLGLSDLLRRIKGHRQVVVSTHDARLADLLERKLRPVTSGERTVRIDLAGWTTEGPSITRIEVPADIAPLRLVASAS